MERNMDESRKAFEAWIKFHCDEDEMNGKLERANSGSNYADSTTDICWMAWHASRAAIALDMPEPFKLAKSSSGLTYYYQDEVDAVLSCAGIKVKE